MGKFAFTLYPNVQTAGEIIKLPHLNARPSSELKRQHGRIKWKKLRTNNFQLPTTPQRKNLLQEKLTWRLIPRLLIQQKVLEHSLLFAIFSKSYSFNCQTFRTPYTRAYSEPSRYDLESPQGPPQPAGDYP